MTAPEPLTPPWAYYRRKGLSEMRPYVAWEPLDGISVSEPDKAWLLDCQSRNADPGGYVARNPRNHADQWYVAQAYFDANFEPVDVPVVARDDIAELVEAVDTFLSRLEGFLGATTAALEAWERGSGPNIPIPVYSAAAARLATSGGKLRAMLARVRGKR